MSTVSVLSGSYFVILLQSHVQLGPTMTPAWVSAYFVLRPNTRMRKPRHCVKSVPPDIPQL